MLKHCYENNRHKIAFQLPNSCQNNGNSVLNMVPSASTFCSGPKYINIYLGLIRIITNWFIVLIYVLLLKEFW
jgi:hypothetical protein